MIRYDMIYIYIFMYLELRTPMTFIFEGQPPKQGFSNRNKGHLGSIGIYTGARLLFDKAETGSPGS